jgi:carbonic anhydrase
LSVLPCIGDALGEIRYNNGIMQDIIAGVRTFQRDVYPQYRELFEALSAGQSPEALVITCSDSRVDPFLFTQAQPGQLFVLRNAGNLVPKYDGLVGGVTATIEFAVVGLKVPNIIVCGHSGCGAIQGLLHPEKLENMPNVADWLHHHAEPVREILSRAGRLGGPDEMEQAVDANVLVQLENLRAHPCVAEALAASRITLHGWVYDIASGAIRTYDEKWQQFAAL